MTLYMLNEIVSVCFKKKSSLSVCLGMRLLGLKAQKPISSFLTNRLANKLKHLKL